MTSSAQDVADDVGDHPVLENLARFGYAMNGLIHLLIAGIAGQIALGGGGGNANSSGALSSIASAPLGQAVLWVGVIGFAALSLWQVLEAVVGEHSHDDGASQWAYRGKSVAKGVTYGVLGFTTWTFASGGGSNSKQTSVDFTARLMSVPAGQYLVLAVGVGVLGVGGYHMYKGITRSFVQDLERTGHGSVGTVTRVTGTIGYVAKGVALLIVGALFALAARQHDPSEATGLDGALGTLARQPFGPVLLGLVALGFAAYGVYSFPRARYARL